MIRIAAFAATLMAALAGPALAAGQQAVVRQQVDDRKAVIATVEPVRELKARARIGGTITKLVVREGDRVAAGDQVALVVDPKLALQIQALESRMEAQSVNRDQAQIDFNRMQQLRPSGIVSQAQFDQARTRLDMAERTLRALRADREVVEQQASEGAVLSPGAGRVLAVPVAVGSVVLPGETIATLAADNYILRLQLPERHARFLKAGDTILVGARGLQPQDKRDAAPRPRHPGVSADRPGPRDRRCPGRGAGRLLRRRAYAGLCRDRPARCPGRPGGLTSTGASASAT